MGAAIYLSSISTKIEGQLCGLLSTRNTVPNCVFNVAFPACGPMWIFNCTHNLCCAGKSSIESICLCKVSIFHEKTSFHDADVFNFSLTALSTSLCRYRRSEPQRARKNGSCGHGSTEETSTSPLRLIVQRMITRNERYTKT